MRVTQFWERMNEQFGPIHADVVARDQAISALGSRSALDAIADGEDPRTVWLAVCAQLDVPAAQRH